MSGAKFLLLSHMRGHIADMDTIVDICSEFGIKMIEDCAHTMGAEERAQIRQLRCGCVFLDADLQAHQLR